jgi:hypothetical protein
VRQSNLVNTLGYRKMEMVSRLLANPSGYGQTIDGAPGLLRSVGARMVKQRKQATPTQKGKSVASLKSYLLGLTSHREIAPRTGIHQPTSRRWEPTTIEQIAMTLPGNRDLTAERLTGLDSDRQEPGQNSRSSRSAGKPRTGRRAVGMDRVGPNTKGKTHAFTG